MSRVLVWKGLLIVAVVAPEVSRKLRLDIRHLPTPFGLFSANGSCIGPAAETMS